MTALINMAGKRVGRLTVIAQAPSIKTRAQWSCICECGNRTVVDGVNLRKGHTISCGCARGERPIRHGAARRSKRSAEFGVWAGMLSRCRNPRNKSYLHYGGRGIVVCERWTQFENFLADMGLRPTPEHSIERVDNDRGYAPDNCIWATRDVQAKNKRPRKPQEVCGRGHQFTEANTFRRLNGKRGCRTCRAIRMNQYYERQRASA